jgi:exosortase
MSASSTTAARGGSGAASRWTSSDALLVLALVAGSVVAFEAGWSDIYVQAVKRTDNGYILVVPFVAAYLAWLRRSRLRFVRRRPSFVGPIVLVGAALLAWWGDETDTRVAGNLAAVLALAACFLTMAGTVVLREFLPAFVALFFLIPVPGEIRRMLAGPLQDLAVGVTQEILDLASIPAERQGNVIFIAGKPILVGEACDGLRMVLALALTVYAFVFSVPLRFSARLVLLAASPFIALLCNIIRLVPTGLAYAYSSESLAIELHDVAGWLMLPVAIVMLFGLVRFMRWLDLPVFTWRFLQA